MTEHAFPNEGAGPWRRRVLPFGLGGIAGAFLVVVLLAGTGSLTLPGAAAASPTPQPPTPTPRPTGEPGIVIDGASIGPADAPVTIEIWADYQCPYCGLFAHAFEPALVREYAGAGKARITFRDYAFLGAESFDAAIAARCADRQGRFWRSHDLLFAAQRGENQGAFARANLLQLARIAGLDEPAFTACLDDPSVRTAVVDETTEGGRLGVKSTPTLRIVGAGGAELLVGVSDFPTIAAAVERASAPPSATPSPGASPSP